MANIKVKIDYPISDGAKVKFRTPCESTSVEGLVVTYPIKNGVGYATKTLRFVDAHGKELSGLGNVFTTDVLVEVLLDVTKGRAFIQNADTNSYIEDIKVTVQRMDEERQTIFAEAGRSVEECNDATKKANEAAAGVVTIEQNTQEKLRFWVGTKAEYEAQKDTIPVNTMCIITDDNADEIIKHLVNDTGRIEIPTGADLNDYLSVGRFKCSSYSDLITLKNCPETNIGFKMDVVSGDGGTTEIVEGTAKLNLTQKIESFRGNLYIRSIYTQADGSITFGAWRKIVRDSESVQFVELGTAPIKHDVLGFDAFMVEWSYRFMISGVDTDYDEIQESTILGAIKKNKTNLTVTAKSCDNSEDYHQLYFYLEDGGYMVNATEINNGSSKAWSYNKIYGIKFPV